MEDSFKLFSKEVRIGYVSFEPKDAVSLQKSMIEEMKKKSKNLINQLNRCLLHHKRSVLWHQAMSAINRKIF